MVKKSVYSFGVLDMGEEPDVKKMSSGSKAPGQDVCPLNPSVLPAIPVKTIALSSIRVSVLRLCQNT